MSIALSLITTVTRLSDNQPVVLDAGQVLIVGQIGDSDGETTYVFFRNENLEPLAIAEDALELHDILLKADPLYGRANGRRS